MDLQDLKDLSKKRILNMSKLYKEADLSVSSMNTRISKMKGSLSESEKKAVELTVINQIEDLIHTLNIDPMKLINALGITFEESKDRHLTKPCAYLKGPKQIHPIYLPGDKIEQRTARSGTGQHLFWDEDQITEGMAANSKLSLTGRGQRLFLDKELQRPSQ